MFLASIVFSAADSAVSTKPAATDKWFYVACLLISVMVIMQVMSTMEKNKKGLLKRLKKTVKDQ